MELIERYVYAVTSKLPEKQKEDIARELKTLISDMVEEQPLELNENEKIQRVLLKLGDPKILADNYRDNKRYLIGPKNFPQYIFVLKIVFIAIFFAITLGSIMHWVFIKETNVISIFTGYITRLFSGFLQGFTWVTIAFAITEYNGVYFKDKKKTTWDLSKLPPYPNKKAMIKKSESIIGIVFISIFTIIFYFYPEIIALYFSKDGTYKVIPFFDLDYYKHVKILILGMFVLGIGREVLKLIYRKWCISLAVYYSICTILSAMLFITFLMNPHIWNPNLAADISKYMGTDVSVHADKSTALNAFIKLIVFINIIEIASVVYKGIKYDRMK